MKNILTLLMLCLAFSSCAQSSSKKDRIADKNIKPVQVSKTDKGYKKAYFSSGCFWCSESIYKSIIGVTKVIPGYSGGTGKDPTYQTYIRKGHAETIEVTYEPSVIDFETLLTVYFSSQNVTQQNGQGPDQGLGYRSIIFYQNNDEKEAIKKAISKVQKHHTKPVAAKARPFRKFWVAEEYHHDYEEKNPTNPYIRNVSLPRLNRFQTNHPELLKENN